MPVSPLLLLLLNILALVFTLSVLLLVLWQGTESHTEQGLLLFLGSVALLQTGTLFTHAGLLLELSDLAVKFWFNMALLGFSLVTLHLLALLLGMAGALKEAWAIVYRSGLTALLVIQPMLWQQGLLELPTPLDDTLFGGSFTEAGNIFMICGLAYMALALWVAWRYWRQINAPWLVGPLVGMIAAQAISLTVPALREYSIASLSGGVVSGMLGYYVMEQARLVPVSPQIVWLQALRDVSQTLITNQALNDVMRNIAEQARRLVRADVVGILIEMGPDRLELVAIAGPCPQALGRQVRSGEGLGGRVMQTLQPMRVENYTTWSGRAADFEDLPFYASMCIPLVYCGKLVGMINVSETKPGRVFTDRDQTVLELMAPQAAIAIVKARLTHELNTVRAHCTAMMDAVPLALMIFDSFGVLVQANPVARAYLTRLMGETTSPPTVLEFAAQARDSRLTNAIIAWTTNLAQFQSLEVEYEGIGTLAVEMRAIPNKAPGTPDLLVMLRPSQPLETR